ncbi:BQ2448_3423 [Microbotryum intermedium]|uniref:BQ2448_3423 protein n=1 Tax=Microbotryum intermedium TaxID=269621 RepID=A0A238FEX8_9BASI|nr:BQ2448_3423 [Microbotryum intermedium]
MSSTLSPDLEEGIKHLLTQVLDSRDRERESRPPPSSPTTAPSDNIVAAPRVPAASSVTFEAVNRLKADTTYPRWHRALKVLVPTPIFAYLQTGNLPAEWSDALQTQWKDYVQSVLFNSLDPSLQVVFQEDKTPHKLYTQLRDRYLPRDAQAYAKLIKRDR